MSAFNRAQSAAVRCVCKKPMSALVHRALCAVPIAALLVCGARAADVQPLSAASAPAAARKDALPAPAATVKPVTDKTKAATQDGQSPPRPSPYAPNRFSGRAGLFYATNWGIDSISVKLVESGELVRFSYRVVDADKAGALHDKQNEATLDDPKAGVSLVVPSMEQVGQLRQTPAPVAGRSYWMTFSNKGRRVARGDRVDVLIGPFRANNLVVD